MTISTAVDPSAVARVLGIEQVFQNLRGSTPLLPQRLAIVGQGNDAVTYDLTKRQVTSASEAGSVYGFGSPLHLATLKVLPSNGDGVGTIPVTLYPLVKDGSGVASIGDVTPVNAATETAAYQIVVNNIKSKEFVVANGDSVASIVAAMVIAVNSILEMPVIATDNATDVILTSKWSGTSSNDLVVEVVNPGVGVTFAITQPVGGLVNPDVSPALLQVGNVWETMMLNCLETGDATNLDRYQVFGDGRYGALVHKPIVVFSGTNETDVNTAVVIPDARKTDKINVQLVAPASNDLPFVIASRQVARIIVLANNNPPHDYGLQKATGLIPGADGLQWDYLKRDLAVKAGSSTIEVIDGVVNISDVVTFYHPVAEDPPAYRYVVDIVKLQNITYAIALVFNTTEWVGSPLIPDSQPTTNKTAKSPSTAIAAMAQIVDSLGLEAMISNPDVAKSTIQAEIDGGNPKRLNISVAIQLSGNNNIISETLKFGFLFGTGQLAA